MQSSDSPHRAPIRTHLYAFAAGLLLGATWLIFPRGEKAHQGTAEKRSTSAAEQAAAPEALRQRDQAAIREMIEAFNSADASYSSAQWKHYRGAFAARRAAHAKQLGELLGLSRTFQNVPDLGPLLSQAAFAGDRTEAAAVFLEWYRRDPAAAFEALESRQRLSVSEDFDKDDDPFRAACGAIQLDDFLAYLRLHPRSARFTSQLPNAFVAALAEKNDLVGLERMLTEIKDPDIQDPFSYYFANAWDSQDPAGDARLILQSPLLREYLVGRIFNTHGPFGSEELRSAMLSQPWPDEDAKKETEAEWAPFSGEPNLPGTESSYGQRSKLYAPLVFRQKMTIDEVRAEMQAKGEEPDPAKLDEKVCAALFTADPAGVIAWATSRGVPAEKLYELANEPLQSQRFSLNPEPADGRRLVRILAASALIGEHNSGPPEQSETYKWASGLRFWLRTNPQSAGAALQSLPASWLQAIVAPPPKEEPSDH